MLEKIRFITDLQSIAKEIKAKGSILVGSLRGNKYLSYIRSITASLRDIDDLEIKDNYKKFLKKLEHYLNGKNIGKLTSLKIICDFLWTDLKLYEGIELSMQGLICAAVKVSVESVVETLVSRYEVHFDKTRQLTETNALHEMEIAENGPTVFRADALLERAMNSYWKTTTSTGKWHFQRTSASIMNYGSGSQGKTVSNLLLKSSKFPMMDI